MPNDPTDINGRWSGHYWYDNLAMSQATTAFVAQFEVDSGSGQINGAVTDLGSVRVASLTGQFDGDTVSFIKTYIGGFGSAPVAYTGRLSEDGNVIAGAWSIEQKLLGLIPVRTSGVWQAQRDSALADSPPSVEANTVWPPEPGSAIG